MISSLTKQVLTVDVQDALTDDVVDGEEPPSAEQLRHWATEAYLATELDQACDAEITLRLVDSTEIAQLNWDFRSKDKSTNVLAFPAELDQFCPPELSQELGTELLGDVVICHSVVVQEAREQQKALYDHYAHMVTHGVLHLCGYDHQDDVSATNMELLETRILAKNNIDNPYQ